MHLSNELLGYLDHAERWALLEALTPAAGIGSSQSVRIGFEALLHHVTEALIRPRLGRLLDAFDFRGLRMVVVAVKQVVGGGWRHGGIPAQLLAIASAARARVLLGLDLRVQVLSQRRDSVSRGSL